MVFVFSAKLTCRTYLAFTYTFLIILIIIFIALFVIYYRQVGSTVSLFSNIKELAREVQRGNIEH